jgi:hypothetical protein
MTGLNHAVTGALVAAVIKEPLIALPAALASHFVIDALPHWDYKIEGSARKRQLIMLADLAFSILLLSVVAFLLTEQWWLVFLGGLLAIVPDMMWLPDLLTGSPPSTKGDDLLSRIRRFHLRIQWSETKNGIFFEIFWFFLVLSLLFIALS